MRAMTPQEVQGTISRQRAEKKAMSGLFGGSQKKQRTDWKKKYQEAQACVLADAADKIREKLASERLNGPDYVRGLQSALTAVETLMYYGEK